MCPVQCIYKEPRKNEARLQSYGMPLERVHIDVVGDLVECHPRSGGPNGLVLCRSGPASRSCV